MTQAEIKLHEIFYLDSPLTTIKFINLNGEVYSVTENNSVREASIEEVERIVNDLTTKHFEVRFPNLTRF